VDDLGQISSFGELNILIGISTKRCVFGESDKLGHILCCLIFNHVVVRKKYTSKKLCPLMWRALSGLTQRINSTPNTVNKLEAAFDFAIRSLGYANK